MSHSQQRKSVSVASFYETGKDALELELDAGKRGMKNPIREAAINRAGLGLTGFFRYFPHKRIQVIGLAEHAYLASLSEQERAQRLDEFFSMKIPCLVIARNRRIFASASRLSEKYGVPVLRTRMITKHFVNAATMITESLMAPRVKMQGTMVELMGIGILIEGKSGMGKSEAALELIRNGAALVSDDITEFRLDSSGALMGSPINVTQYHMEIKGLGIIHVPSLFGVASVREIKKLDLVVTLCKPDDKEIQKAEIGASYTCDILGAKVPRIYLPVAPGRNLANVIQTAALDQRLRRLGHDAAKELDANLISSLSKGAAWSE